MKLGASFLLNFEGIQSIKDFLFRAKDVAFNVVELVAEPPYCFINEISTKARKEIKNLAEKLGLLLTIHATFSDINIASINPNVRTFAIQEVKRCIDFALEVGSNLVTFHPGDYGAIGMSYPDLSSRINYESIEILAEYAKSKEVILGLENMPSMGSNQLKDSYDILILSEIIQKINSRNLRITWDVGHSHTFNYSIDECYHTFKEYMIHIHLHDNTGPVVGWSDAHLPIGQGTINWQRFFELVKDTNVSMVFELNNWDKILYSSKFLTSFL